MRLRSVQTVFSVSRCTRHRYLHLASSAAPRPKRAPAMRNEYKDWTNEQLIERVTKLEQQLKEQTSTYAYSYGPFPDSLNCADILCSLQSTLIAPTTPPKKKKPEKPFDPSRYHTRYIALKLAYLGQAYNGFEHHNNNVTPLPTIEEELWKALSKTKLIFPAGKGEVDWEGCEYSKCGRTDRGVSAFGQVVGIRVRSSRPKVVKKKDPATSGDDEVRFDGDDRAQHVEQQTGFQTDAFTTSGGSECVNTDNTVDTPGTITVGAVRTNEDQGWHHIHDELPYIRLLNRVLPPTIRILAWCPSPPPDFSARFSCRERRYRYFFTQPAFTPAPGTSGLRKRRIDNKVEREGWLDIEAMREAASYYVGEHDFRNFCKVDPARGITNYERTMFKATIEETDASTGLPAYLSDAAFAPKDGTNRADTAPRVYSFNLHGSAFLWHQVRHMVAVLFLVGQGLEEPAVVKDMLDVTKTPAKPFYEMADDAPLVLWDCVFPDLAEADADGFGTGGAKNGGYKDTMEWVYVDGQGSKDNPARSLPSGSQHEKENAKTGETHKTGSEARRQNPNTSASYAGHGDGRFGPGGLQDVVWSEWRQRKIDEVLAGSLLNLVASQTSSRTARTNGMSAEDGVSAENGVSAGVEADVPPFSTQSTKVFDGGNTARLRGEYVPLLERPRQESVEVLNKRFAERKGGGVRDEGGGGGGD